jgi:hypothetical protein
MGDAGCKTFEISPLHVFRFAPRHYGRNDDFILLFLLHLKLFFWVISTKRRLDG